MSSVDDDNSISGITKALSALPISRKLYSTYAQSDTDTAGSDNCCQTPLASNKSGTSISHRIRQKRRPNCGYHSDNSPAKGAILPPIGVFWDIENCQVPRGRSAVCIAQLIRDLFFDGFREAEFIVVCDVKKETNQVVQELCDAQVNLIHVSSTSKNAADEKLRQCMRRFADTHGAPSAIILISGDVNFAADLSDLRHRKKIHVILLHKQNVSKALILCASEHHCFTELTDNVPPRTSITKNATSSPYSGELTISNLPLGHEAARLKARLRQLSDNCGGRVARIDSETGTAVLKFSNDDLALRAQKRMDGEDVFGNKIYATHNTPIIMRFGCEAPRRDSPNKAGRKYRQDLLDMDEGYQTMASTASWAPLPPMPQFMTKVQPINWNAIGDLNSHLCVNPMQQYYNCPLFTSCTQDISHTTMVPNCSMPNSNCNQIWPGDKIFTGLKDDHDIPRPRSTSFGKNEYPNEKRLRGPTGDSKIDCSTSSAFSRTPLQNWPNAKHSITRSENKNIPRPNSSSPWLQNNQSQASNNSSENSSDAENFFQPIHKTDNGPIELHVSNLDQTIDQFTMQQTLLSMFKEHATVLNLQVYTQNDGSMSATVKVPSRQHAQYVISQMHRRRIGFKRILISYSNEAPNLQMLKSQVMSLLQSIPGHSLALFKFRELFEVRYLVSVSLSELYKMRDICTITEDSKGRIVTLNPEHRDTPSPQLAGQESEQPFCAIHCKVGLEKCWALQTTASLPNVFIGIQELTQNLNKLLKSHSGCVPLPSLAICYEADLGLSLDINDKTGVPLEHLVSCCSGVSIKQGITGVKHLIYAPNKLNCTSDLQNEDMSSHVPKCTSPALAHQMIQFSREIVDLLRTTSKCQLLFNKFIPAYHHHFGRQCRVADYGYTKLIDLMDALTNTVQVMGDGNKRTVTLTHRAQIKRFTSDLCRVLKTQNSKQMLLSDLPNLFEKVLDRPWDITEYGVCQISDILDEVNENTIVRNKLSNDTLITTPKHEQTAEEIRKTNIFKVEVIELLRHAPQYSMQFNKFVPAYHHHFGHQCRVSDYGFTKLIELFEAVPDIVKVNESSDTERYVSLMANEAVKVLGEQLEQILSVSSKPMSFSKVCNEFIKLYGYALEPDLYESEDILQVLEKFSHIKVVKTASDILVSLEDRAAIHRLGIRAWSVLLNVHSMKVHNFLEKYNKIYAEGCDLEKLSEAKDIVNISHPITMISVIKLTPLWEFAAKALVCCERGHITLSIFENSYFNLFRKQIDPKEYGFQSLSSLISAIPEVLLLKERNNRKRYICVNSDLLKSGICLPPSLPIYNNESSSSISSDSISSGSKRRVNQSEIKRKHSNLRTNSKRSENMEKSMHQTPNYFDGSGFCNDFGNSSDYLSDNARNSWPPVMTNTTENFEKVGNSSNNVANDSALEIESTKPHREYPPGLYPLYDFFYDLNLSKSPKSNSSDLETNKTDINTSGSTGYVSEGVNNEKAVNTIEYPSGPLYNFMQEFGLTKFKSAPKPDSPNMNTNDAHFWDKLLWDSPDKTDSNFVVNLPPSTTEATVNMDLISPTLSLISCPNPFAAFNSPTAQSRNQQAPGTPVSDVLVQAPPPSELPKPSPSLVGPKKDEQDTSTGIKTPNSLTKRKGRIAAIFPSSKEQEFNYPKF